MAIYDPLLATKKFDALPNDILVHWCPGCKQVHPISIVKPNVCNAFWKWDGSVEKPTFQPSFHLTGYCHYFIRDGMIEYLHDCQHDLKGQTIPIPDLPDWW